MLASPGRADRLMERFLPLHPKKIDLSLGRIERLLGELDHPETRLPPVIHVAGTNGKGSTLAFMRAMLEAAGKAVHVYTSPHLVRFHERIRLAHPGGGRLVDDDTLAEAFELCERVNDGRSISVFEITTAAAFTLFAAHPADYLLLEVGLGGRFDATNVVPAPAATVVTPVSMDHPEFLGRTVEAIAFEKAGILKAGAPAILAEQDPAALAVLRRQAERLGVKPIVGGEDFHCHEEHGRLVYQDENGLLDLPLPRLVGRHQHGNAGTAVATLRRVEPDLGAEAHEAGLLKADWPARLQPLRRGRLPEVAPDGAELWLDGGHNADGGRVLAEALGEMEERQGRPLILVCGMLSTKDPAAFLIAFKGLAQELLAVPVGGEHSGREAEEIASIARRIGIEAACCAGVEAALRYLAARRWREPPRILITGSLYLAGDVLALNGTLPD